MSSDIDFEKFKKYVNEQIKLFNNAGMAISFVSSNEVLFEEGFGYRNVSEKLPFTTKTLFPLGSHTKSFTATAIALLVDKNLLDWDAPIRDYIPQFRLKDPYASEKASIRDVLSHTTGLPHHQFTFMNTEWNYKEIFKRLPHLKPVYEFRTKHKYSNLNYFIATKIIEEITGKNYFSFMKDKFFKPLGMKNTNFSVDISFKTDDYTKGYRKTDDGFAEEFYPDLQHISAGAGSINSCLTDMNKWFQFHLNKGMVNGKQLISEKSLSNLYITQRMDKNPLVAIVPGKNYVQNYGFALGWWTFIYRGSKIYQHYGTGPGIMFNGGFMPNNDLGFILFSNTSGSDLPFVFNFDIADQILGLDLVNWGSKLMKFEEMIAKMTAKREEASVDPQKKNTKPSHSIEEFVGIYHHPGYGKLEFILEENQLIGKFGKDSKLETNHYHYDTYTITITHLGGFGVTKFVTFRDNFKGEISHLEINAEPMLDPVRFEKIVEEDMK